ncbi:MAG: S-layer family protein [Nitrosomonadales bacterium]|nr:S-layer family protein [Nitrosomonadales bacterium]
MVTLNGTVSSNGGNLNFYKATTLAHATPISTTPLTAVAAGNVTFHQGVTLAAPTYGVTIGTQGASSGGFYTAAGGNVDFMGSIDSGTPTALPPWPQGLTIDTSGTAAGSITLGSLATDTIGTLAAPLRKLTLIGPTSTTLNAGEIDIQSTSGDVLVATSTLGTPKLVLVAPDTVINVTGGTLSGVTGYANYKQDTFDIGVLDDAVSRTLTINSDRSIKITNHSIDGTKATGSGTLDVTLNPFKGNLAAATGGAVILDTSTIKSNGGFIKLGGPTTNLTDYAVGYGADDQGIYDGIRLTNSKLLSSGGAITLQAKAPTTTSAGAGVKLTGALTDINAGAGNLTITGLVTGETTAGNKDAVILGEGGASRVTLQTTTGNISITGDANSGGWSNPTGGSRYDGVILSSRALVQTGSGNIDIVGNGGGGDYVYITENHGIKLEDTDTSVVSSTGNITLTGTTGGKTSATQGENSFGIYSRGNTMYLGAAAAGSATGILTLNADTMEFVNSSAYHLNAASSGELRIQPLTAGRNVAFINAALPAVDQLYLGNDWFNGTSFAIFRPGFGGTGYGTPASGATGSITIGRADATGIMTVTDATTIRDNTTLLMGGLGGKIAINGPLTVQGSGAPTARTLTLDTNAGATAAGTIAADALQLLGSGDYVLTGTNLLNTIAANITGRLVLNNGQALSVGATSNESLGGVTSITGITTAGGNDISLITGTGDLTLNQSVTAGGVAAVSLGATNGAVKETVGAAIVSADKLYVTSLNSSLLNNSNVVNTLAGNITGLTQGLEFKNSQALVIGQVPVTPLTANIDGTVTTGAVVNNNGITASGTAAIQLPIGDLTQTQDVTVGGLQLALTNGSVNLSNTTNDIGTLAANLVAAGTTLTVKDKNALTVGALTSSGDAGSIIGATTGITTNVGNVTLSAANVAAGDLTLDQYINTGAGVTTADLSSVNGAIVENAAVPTAIVTADSLLLTAKNTSLLNNQNAVNTLAANITGNAQGLDFANGKALVVGLVNGVSGLTIGGVGSRGNVLLDTSGAAATGATITQTDAITAAGLLLHSRGDVTLTLATNDIVALAANTSATDVAGYNLSYRDANDFAVGSLAPNAGGTATAGITAGGIADGKTVKLESSTGAITQSAASPITTQDVNLTAATGATLDEATNDVATLSGRVSGAGQFVFSDKNALSIGTVADIAATPVAGVQTVNGQIRLSASKDVGSTTGDLALTQDVIAGSITPSTMALEALKGAVTETVNVNLTAASLLVNAQNTTALENTVATGGKHSIGTLAANVTGSLAGTGAAAHFSFRNDQALTVGSVTGQDTVIPTNGVTTADGNIQLATLADSLISEGITISQNVSAGNSGNVDIRAGGATAGDIAVNGGTIQSGNGTGTGTVQLVAGRNISTSTLNGATDEIVTGGDALLIAGGAIGIDGSRIETSVVGNLAAESAGAQWLRQTAGNLTVGAVTALNTGVTFGGAAANKAGLATTLGSNAAINVNAAAGALTVTSDISADGSGTVDVRTGGANAVAINGATLRSGTGQVQVIAGGDITTSTLNGVTDEIATTGNALLVSGGMIGADGSRIESNGVATLAAESVGAQWLRQTVGNLTVGAVTALAPTDNAVDNAAANKAGLATTLGSNAAINVNAAAGALTVTSDISADGSGTVDVRTGGVNAVAINGATLRSGTGQVQVIAGGDITTSTLNGVTDEIATTGNALLVSGGMIGADGSRIESNGVATLAAESVGAQWLRQTAGNLTVGAVTALAPTDNAVDNAAANKAGLATTLGSNAAINVNAAAGALTVTSDISADGSGTVDVRTGGVNAVAINGATLRSGTGQVQVIAGGDITTSTLNGVTDEIATTGNALLVSGGMIGADGSRIESNGVATLAAESVGAQWLRQTAGNLTVGAVTALAPTDNAVDNAAANKAGLATTLGSNAAINVNAAAGALTVTSDISADGSGTVDVRTGGVNAVAINGATLRSGTGQVQVIAGGDITTSTLNGVTDEIATTGNALLVSGGAIGAAGNLIETNGVLTLAAQSPGMQWLSQTAGNLTVGAVTALAPLDDAVDNAALSKAGLVTTNSDIFVGTVNGGLAVTQAINPGAANVTLQTRGVGSTLSLAANVAANILTLDAGLDISQTAGILTASSAEVLAAGNASLTSNTNDLVNLAANVTGNFAYYDANDLTIAVVGVTTGVDAGTVWIRDGRDLFLNAPVIGRSAGNAVVLAATRQFWNTAGANAVSAPPGAG